MTLVIKTIKGRDYHYYQDSVKTGDKNKIVTTCICSTDISGRKLLAEKSTAFMKHIFKILKFSLSYTTQTYTFEHMTSEDPNELNDIINCIKFFYAFYIKLLTPSELEDFKKVLFTQYVYGTTAIEGNTLTEDETFRLLADDLTPKNKTVNETLEVANYIHVQEYVDRCSGNISEKMILQIHKLLMTGIRGQNGKLIRAGDYRTGQVILLGIEYRPPPPELVSAQVKLLVNEHVSRLQSGVHPLEAASLFHQKFEEIHPFQDGNGRVGREIFNYMLTSGGYPPIYVTPKQRSQYLSALQDGNIGNHTHLFEFFQSRLIGTIQYLLAKTSLYDILTSATIQEFASELEVADIYANTLKVFQQIHNDPELP